MKAIINITLIALVAFTFSSCTTKEVPKEAQVGFTFENMVDQKGVEFESPFNYINKAGNPYNVSELSYALSNVVLIDNGDNEITINTTSNISGLSGGQISDVTLPNGTYKSMRITVSSFIHKGKFLDGSNDQKNISIDFSGGGSEQTFEIPVGGLTVNGVAKTAYVTFNLNDAYDAGTDFNNGATQAEVTPVFGNAFSFSGSFDN